MVQDTTKVVISDEYGEGIKWQLLVNLDFKCEKLNT